MKAYLAGMRERCLRVAKYKKKLGWVHSSAKVPHAQGSGMLQFHTDHGGVRLRVCAFARHLVSNKVIRLKKWLRSWRADLPDESMSRRDAWWMFEGRIPTKQIEWRRVNVSFHFNTQRCTNEGTVGELPQINVNQVYKEHPQNGVINCIHNPIDTG
jgi:hypothetical protein